MSIATSAIDRTTPGDDVDERDVRAAEEYLAVIGFVPGMYHVYSESGTEYTVDVRTASCTCPDAEYRNVRCKHTRRVEMVRGTRPVPAGVRVDPLLSDQRDQEADS